MRKRLRKKKTGKEADALADWRVSDRARGRPFTTMVASTPVHDSTMFHELYRNHPQRPQ